MTVKVDPKTYERFFKDPESDVLAVVESPPFESSQGTKPEEGKNDKS